MAMTSTRVGVDIVGTDKTRAAFASAQNSVSRFGTSFGVLKGAMAGAFAGFAAGGFVQSMIRSFVDVNKHTAAVKNSFVNVDRAWQQFALNVGKSGLNDAIIRFNRALVETMGSGRSLASILGSGLGAAIDAVSGTILILGKAAEFTARNIAKLSAALNITKSILPDFTSSLFSLEVGGKKMEISWAQVGRALQNLGLDMSAFQSSTAPLPKTFEEVAAANRKAEDAAKKLREAYRGGIKDLQTYANGVMLQSQTFGMGEAAAARYTKKYEFLNKMQEAGVRLTAAQTKEMNGWLNTLFASTVKLQQQNEAFKKFEEQKQKMAETFTQVGDIFKSSFGTAFDSIINRTSSVSGAFKQMARDMLKTVTSLFMNQAFKMLIGGYSGGSNGIAGIGTGLVGKLVGSIFGGGTFSGLYAKGGTIPAGSWGIAGENGPERIYGPATVVPGGMVGKPANVNVQIIDMRKNAPPVEVKNNHDGSLRVMVRDQVNQLLGTGELDAGMGRYVGGRSNRRRS